MARSDPTLAELAEGRIAARFNEGVLSYLPIVGGHFRIWDLTPRAYCRLLLSTMTHGQPTKQTAKVVFLEEAEGWHLSGIPFSKRFRRHPGLKGVTSRAARIG